MAAEAKVDETNVVLVGFWNPAILTPAWLAKHVFALEVDVPVEMELSPVAGQPPRFKMQGLRFSPAYNRLTVVPEGLEGEQLTTCETRLRVLLNALPHTPISAFGINYAFEDAAPSEALLDLFSDQEGLAERTGLAFESQSTGVQRAMAMNGYVLNFTRSLSAPNTVKYKFNFHYSVTDAESAAALLNDAMTGNLQVARQIVLAYDNLGEGHE
jgi:hypothetical protein